MSFLIMSLLILVFISLIFILKSIYVILKKSNRIKIFGSTYENLSESDYRLLLIQRISGLLILIYVILCNIHIYNNDILPWVIPPLYMFIPIIILTLFNLFVKNKIKSKKIITYSYSSKQI